MSQIENQSEVDLRHYLRILRRRKWLVILAVVVVVGIALAVSLRETPTYQSSAQVMVQSSSYLPPSVFSQSQAANLGIVDPAQIQSEMRIITSTPAREEVRTKLGAAPSVSVSELGQTNIVQITASSADPRRAAEIANAYATAYIDVRRNQNNAALLAAASQLQSKINTLQQQIDALNAKVAAAPQSQQQTLQANLGPQRDNLITEQGLFKQNLDELQVDTGVGAGSAQLISSAQPPTSPSSPRPARNALLGLAIGLVIGVGGAFLREHFDDSVRSRSDVERATNGLPDLGAVPRVRDWTKKGRPLVISLTKPTSPAAEAYRGVRTAISFVSLDRAVRILQVTSPNATEGKTATVANLGAAFAQAGQRVCVCCCDLRRPRLYEFYGLENTTGLTSVVQGETSLFEAVQPVPGVENLSLLASGPRPPNPAELLASPRTVEVMRSLGRMYDLVLVDSAPVLPVTDAAVVTAFADAVMLVVEAGSTTGRAISRTVEILHQVNAPLIGTMLNSVTADTGAGDYYYYRHRYYRYELPEAASHE